MLREMSLSLLFRQLLDPETSTWSYLLADRETREAVLIDGVLEQQERDLALLRELGARIGVSAPAGVANADVPLGDGDLVRFGRHALEVRLTPGHTNGCASFVCHEAGIAFTGDALLIRGCGRTDFQQGDAHALFRSVRERIFSLPDATFLYPAHDYKGRTVTTVAEEKRWNPRLGLARSEAEFAALMAGLKLAYPKRIDVAVPANLESGLTIPAAPEERPVAGVMQQQGRQDAEAWLGEGI